LQWKAAKIYDMQILAKDIADNSETILGSSSYQKRRSCHWKDKTASSSGYTCSRYIVHALGEFAKENQPHQNWIRPTSKTLEYNFYLILKARTEKKCADALKALRSTLIHQVLGSYAKANVDVS